MQHKEPFSARISNIGPIILIIVFIGLLCLHAAIFGPQ